MATTEQLMSQYGIAWFGFDEGTGNVIDMLSNGYVGTITGASRVEGWNGEGKAINFNGINNYITMNNNSFIPLNEKTIRFKLKMNNINKKGVIIGNSVGYDFKGIRIYIDSDNTICFYLTVGGASTSSVLVKSTEKISEANKWYDILISKNANNTLVFYINGKEDSVHTLIKNEVTPNESLIIGRRVHHNDQHLDGQLDDLQIYNKALSPSNFTQRRLVFKSTDNKNIVLLEDKIREIPTLSEKDLVQYGTNIEEIHFSTSSNPIDLNKSYTQYETVNTNNEIIINSIEPTTAKEILGEIPQVVYYTESDCTSTILETNVEPFSVYDYIGELPEVLVYKENNEDIIVSTTTEPFDLYDEFGDSVEVLYYTDDTEVTNADLILEANYSPLDELEGDFEVVTWTDEAPETAQRVLEMQAIPKPQFIKLVNPKRIYGALDDVIVNDISQSYRDEARYFVSGTDTTKWYVWDKVFKKFVITDASSEEAIIANGMKHTDLNNISDTEWRTWDEQHLNIGIFLKDNPRDTIVSVVENISYEDYLPRHTTAIQDTSLYILNTTAKIDIAFNGNVLKGVLSDDDLTRVQYRVLLNNRHFYPSDGSFTKLGESPQNIELVIRSKDIKIDDWNTLKVEFKDYFGTTDYWSTNFMGTYSGLMFKDVHGEYFSNEIGDVLKYLDFGVIIAGQTTIEHEVILKNQYGYDVKNVHLFANTANFPTEMTVEFSQSQSPFIPYPDLKLSGVLANNAEMPFFVRLKTKLGSTPDANGSFDIIVRADKA
ncbi:LamG domain-containing protein [Lysinibacillus sp. NPDC093197]|uniref:LamG domain-containing protein n=1 Tax=Lysinibacillus sp. NPDC093197 TaxID=3364132 RepID=UPI00381E78BC